MYRSKWSRRRAGNNSEISKDRARACPPAHTHIHTHIAYVDLVRVPAKTERDFVRELNNVKLRYKRVRCFLRTERYENVRLYTTD